MITAHQLQYSVQLLYHHQADPLGDLQAHIGLDHHLLDDNHQPQIANGDQNFFAIQGSKVQSLMLASPSSENLKIQLFTANTLPYDPRLVSTYAYFK